MRYEGGARKLRSASVGCGYATGIKVSNQGTKYDGNTEHSLTILARDYKGFGNQTMTGVLEGKDERFCN